MLLVPLIAGGLIALWLWPSPGPGTTGPEESEQVETAPAPNPPPAVDPEPSPEPAEAAPPPRQAVWNLVPASERDVPVPCLLLEAPSGAIPEAYLFLSLDAFPLHGGMTAPDGSELDLGVVTWSQDQGYALLSLGQAAPEGLELSPARSSNTLAAGEELWVSGVEEVTAVSGRQGGLLVLRGEAPRGQALIDQHGNVVALTQGGNLALPVDAAIPWLGRPQQDDLETLRRQLRIGFAELALEDATDLLSRRRSVADAREALALIDRAATVARTREDLLALEEARRTAARILVQELARVDPASALTEVRQQRARHPDHPGLLADMLVLALGYGDPTEAIGLFDELRALSPDHAQEVAEDLARGLSNSIRARLAGRRQQEAIDLAAAAVSRFPQRGDLRMLYAEALWQGGRQSEAVEQGLVASQLDPSHSEQVGSWQASLARARDPGTVTLPYDPATNAIFTQVTIEGQPLELMIDTGASLTTIPTEFARRLNLVRPDSQTITVTTASGEVLGRRVRLPSLVVGSIRLRQVDAVVFDIPGLEGRGLLGLNVLRPLNMQIDSENKVLILQRPQGRRRR